MDESFKNVLREIETKALAKFEQQLPEVRHIYEEMEQDTRAKFRGWLEALSNVCESAPDLLEMCTFRPKPNTDSGASRTWIPTEAEHGFRAHPNTDSSPIRTSIPGSPNNVLAS